ncbi:MAG: SLC13 family permease, partial [Magnetospirillum sp.]
MENLIPIVFGLTYLGMALGRVPGLKLDRTGIALIAAVVLLASGKVAVEDAGAAIDMSTMLLLFALMLVSAQFQEAGLYRVVAGKLAVDAASSDRLLALVIGISGLLSAVLANDIVVFAMAPMLVEGVRGRGMDPRPFLLALAGGANAGSAMTIIGNPQNILIGQVGGLDFWRFLLVCGVPAVVAMILVFFVIRRMWRTELSIPPVPAAEGMLPQLDVWQTVKGGAAVIGLLVLFATDLPREVGALAVAAPLLLSRRLASRDMIGAVDWHLLVLFACLFVVTDSFAASPWAASGVEWLAERQWLPDR